MDALAPILLLAMGFAVGLSGALMPGPLLLYTIQESLKKGRWTGLVVILGHMTVEVFIFAAIILGLNEFMTSRPFVTAVSLLGGTAMIWMAAASLRDASKPVKTIIQKKTHNTLIGGVIFTAFNPGFPIWWATAGTTLLMEGLRQMGQAGMLLVFIGHWGADLGWFLLVSMITAKSSGLLFEKGWYRNVRKTLAIALLAIGLYFIASVFT
jgi:threonine/homoserine/homoserine lactone efflux protein